MKENIDDYDEQQFYFNKYKKSIENAQLRLKKDKYKWSEEEKKSGINGDKEWDKIWANPLSYKILEKLMNESKESEKNKKITQ